MRICLLRVESGIFAGLCSGCEYSETFDLYSKFESKYLGSVSHGERSVTGHSMGFARSQARLSE